MSKENVLVVEDEEDIAELIRFNLVLAGFRARVAESGEEAMNSIRENAPDLVILDLMLPGMDGLEVCKRLRADETTRRIPIVMLTARGEETDIVVGLELGADDYIVKPFSPKVLVARVRAVLRRDKEAESHDQDSVLRVGKIVIHPGRHEVLVDGHVMDLTPTEFGVLHCLARRPGWVLTRDKIVEATHGPGYPVTDRAVDVQIAGLRKKLGDAGECIETVRGIGYRFRE